MATSAGGWFKSMQVLKVPSLDEMKANLQKFLNTPNIEVIQITHQFNDGLTSVMVYYKK